MTQLELNQFRARMREVMQELKARTKEVEKRKSPKQKNKIRQEQWEIARLRARKYDNFWSE